MLIKSVAHTTRALSHKLVSSVVDLVAPPLCAGCKLFLPERAILCAPCLESIVPVPSIMIPVTSSYQMKVFAISNYTEPIRPMILAKSWGNIVASTQLGELLWQLTPIRYVQFDYIVPVPLHWTRYAKRGYNQAEEMANAISHASGKPVVHLVKRSKRTPFQSTLEVSERTSNVEDAFSLTVRDKAIYKGKHLLIIDDLLTTGATLRATARELRRLNPEKLTAVVAARVV